MLTAGWRLLAVTAAVFGFAAVILAALGSHAIPLQDARAERLWDTALLIHLFHTVAMLTVAALSLLLSSGKLVYPGLTMAVGTVLFSGSLYLRAAGVDLLPSFMPPIGGLFLTVSWLALLLLVARKNTA
jgi:uncharacterized membrane protein YgdD (TMEM256/DUF423 family)